MMPRTYSLILPCTHALVTAVVHGRFLHAGLGILIGSRNCLYTRMLDGAGDTAMTCVTPNEEGTRHGLRRVTPYDKNWTQAQMLGALSHCLPRQHRYDAQRSMTTKHITPDTPPYRVAIEPPKCLDWSQSIALL